VDLRGKMIENTKQKGKENRKKEKEKRDNYYVQSGIWP
jgi:hypothetical protein